MSISVLSVASGAINNILTGKEETKAKEDLKGDLKGDGGPDSVDIYANEALNDQEAKRVRELQNILKDEGGVLAEEEKETLLAV